MIVELRLVGHDKKSPRIAFVQHSLPCIFLTTAELDSVFMRPTRAIIGVRYMD